MNVALMADAALSNANCEIQSSLITCSVAVETANQHHCFLSEMSAFL